MVLKKHKPIERNTGIFQLNFFEGTVYLKKIIFIPGSVKKQLESGCGSGSGFRFFSRSGFNEYGYETLLFYHLIAEQKEQVDATFDVS